MNAFQWRSSAKQLESNKYDITFAVSCSIEMTSLCCVAWKKPFDRWFMTIWITFRICVFSFLRGLAFRNEIRNPIYSISFLWQYRFGALVCVCVCVCMSMCDGKCACLCVCCSWLFVFVAELVNRICIRNGLVCKTRKSHFHTKRTCLQKS